MAVTLSDKDQMLMNWPERVWIYSPVRVFFQKREADRWLRQVGRIHVERALEIGCGLGRGARILAEKMGFRWVAAFDLEEILVHRSAKRLPPRFDERIAFFVGDAQDLPFPDGSFDAVVNYGIIHHVLDWRGCIGEISRVLKPDGVFYFEEIFPPLYRNLLMRYLVRHPSSDRFDGPQFLAALSENGLELTPYVKTDSRFGIVGTARKIGEPGSLIRVRAPA